VAKVEMSLFQRERRDRDHPRVVERNLSEAQVEEEE
jgi:hypothetical protein